MEGLTIFRSAQDKHFRLAELMDSVKTPARKWRESIEYNKSQEDASDKLTHFAAAPAAPASVRKQ